jgi:hypothetical protein
VSRRRIMRGKTGCAVSEASIPQQRLQHSGVYGGSPGWLLRRGLGSSVHRVALEGFWSPVGLKTSFFECDTDALSRPQCLPGTPDENESLAVVNICAKV